MYIESYFQAVEHALAKIRSTQCTQIEQAAEAVANSLATKGVFAVMDTGHLLRHEAHLRAGGLLAITPFAYTFEVETDMPQRKPVLGTNETAAYDTAQAALALDSGKLCTGDVLLINSNSGRTANVIEIAIQCKQRGIFTIGMSSLEQMEKCGAAHPSGKKLLDVVDVAIDNGSPYGDASVPVKDNEPMCPLSGITSAYIFWAIQAQAVELLQARDINPSIYRSVHVGSAEFVEKQRAMFVERGI